MNLRMFLSGTGTAVLCSAFLATTLLPADIIPPDDTSNLVTVEPDMFFDGADISTATSGVVLSAFGGAPDFGHPLFSNRIFARVPHQPGDGPPTGTLVFGVDSDFFNTGFYLGNHQFRADFTSPTNYVSILVAPDGLLEIDPTDFALIQIFGVGGGLLDSFETFGDATSVVFLRPQRDVSYVIATNPPDIVGDSFMLDELVFRGNVAVPEPSVWSLLAAGMLAVGIRRLVDRHSK